jgi:hypothetical protein
VTLRECGGNPVYIKWRDLNKATPTNLGTLSAYAGVCRKNNKCYKVKPIMKSLHGYMGVTWSDDSLPLACCSQLNSEYNFEYTVDASEYLTMHSRTNKPVTSPLVSGLHCESLTHYDKTLVW